MPALLYIQNKAGKKLGVVACENGAARFVGGEEDPEFAKFFHERVFLGIPVFVDKYDRKTGNFNMMSVIVPKENMTIPALRYFLRHEGYFVREKDTEIEDGTKRLLNALPEGIPERNELLRRLPDMSRLEQTFLFEELKKL